MTKTERIQFRVSKKDKNNIKNECVKQGITISEYMHRKVFDRRQQ